MTCQLKNSLKNPLKDIIFLNRKYNLIKYYQFFLESCKEMEEDFQTNIVYNTLQFLCNILIYCTILFNNFQQHIKIQDIKWIAGPVKFFVNTEGCGYPPRVNCTDFAKLYGQDRENVTFPCYYSKRYPEERVVAHFDWNDTIKNLILAISIPNTLFGLSIGILSYWYCWPNIYDRRPNVLSTTYASFNSTQEHISTLRKK